MALLSVYVDEFRTVLRDSGHRMFEAYLGDAVRNSWSLQEFPVSSGSIQVTVDGAVQSSGDLTVDYTLGTVLITSGAPSLGAQIEITYLSLDYTDSILIEYIDTAIVTVESIHELGYAITGSGDTREVTPDPSNDLKRVWLNMGKFLIRYDDLNSDMQDAINFRDGDKSINTTTTIQVQKGILDSMYDKILWDIKRLLLNATEGDTKLGGSDPLDYMEFDSGTGPGTEDILWYNGEIND